MKGISFAGALTLASVALAGDAVAPPQLPLGLSPKLYQLTAPKPPTPDEVLLGEKLFNKGGIPNPFLDGGMQRLGLTETEIGGSFFDGLRRLDRRSFMRLAGVSAGIAAARGLVTPQSFPLISVAEAATPSAKPRFSLAYISDSHLYKKELNDRFVRSLLRAVDDINRLDPQPDFVLSGGDLAQLGQKEELNLGREILKGLKAPVKMMVGEHDWFLDMGEHWRSLFGEPQYSFDHKGVHFITLMSVNEKDFWTARGMTPMERMQTVAGLDNGVQSRFEVGPAGHEGLASSNLPLDVGASNAADLSRWLTRVLQPVISLKS